MRPGQARAPSVSLGGGGGGAGDHKVMIDAADSTPDYLGAKIVLGFGLLEHVLYPAGNEQLQILVDLSTLEPALEDDDDDTHVAVTSADLTTGYLDTKIKVGANLSKTVENTGLSEDLKIDLAAAPAVDAIYIPSTAGPSGPDGSWRILMDGGGDLSFEHRETGVWVPKQVVAAI